MKTEHDRTYVAIGKFYDVKRFLKKYFPTSEMRNEEDDEIADFLCDLSLSSDSRDEYVIKEEMGEFYSHRIKYYGWEKRKLSPSSDPEIVAFLAAYPEISVRFSFDKYKVFVGTIVSEACPFFPHRKIDGGKLIHFDD